MLYRVWAACEWGLDLVRRVRGQEKRGGIEKARGGAFFVLDHGPGNHGPVEKHGEKRERTGGGDVEKRGAGNLKKTE